MEVKLLYSSPIRLVISGIRKCYDSGELSDSYEDSWFLGKYNVGPKDKALIKRIIESGHESTLEHMTYTFDIDGFSRDVLQEFSRHRVGVSPSVKSTRYTLKELKDETSFQDSTTSKWDMKRVSEYCVLTDIHEINVEIAMALDGVRLMIKKGYPNDKVKYCAPGAYKTSGQYTFNARSLRHLLSLRDTDRALWEFQLLAKELVKQIPEEDFFMFEDVVREETRNGRKS